MKAIEIEKIYTDKIAEYLAKGYTINPATMSGHQGEIAKIDLKKDDEIIRILLDRTHCWDRVNDRDVDAVVLKVGRNTDTFTKLRRPFDTWNTVWNEHLEILEQRFFYQICNDADYFTESAEEYFAMKDRQLAHWKIRKPYESKDFDLTNPALMALAVRFLKRRTGKSRILRDAIKITKHTNRDGKSEYRVEYNNRAYALH